MEFMSKAVSIADTAAKISEFIEIINARTEVKMNIIMVS